MALNTATEIVNRTLGYITYALVAYLIYLSVTGGADDPIEMWAALLLAAIGYSLHHGKDAIIAFINAYKGNDRRRPRRSDKNRTDDQREESFPDKEDDG